MVNYSSVDISFTPHPAFGHLLPTGEGFLAVPALRDSPCAKALGNTALRVPHGRGFYSTRLGHLLGLAPHPAFGHLLPTGEGFVVYQPCGKLLHMGVAFSSTHLGHLPPWAKA